jgi:hypothetical protein
MRDATRPTATGILRYRMPRARVAVAYSSKDRTELTRQTVAPLLDALDLDLFWFDGSVTDAGQGLPVALCPGRPAACELHQGVAGGPDSAIIHALRTLRPLGYDLVILLENDVLVVEGWLDALRACIAAAEADGFRVGAASVRVQLHRVLSVNGAYALLFHTGAGFYALKPDAIDIVLDNYRTGYGEELRRLLWALTGRDEYGMYEFGHAIAADCMFDPFLYLHGYVVAGPLVCLARNVDPRDAQRAAAAEITSPDAHPDVLRALIRGPEDLRPICYPFARFQKSLVSDRLLVGCHQLRVAVNQADATAPVRARGTWRRHWRQAHGPFGLYGSGAIAVAMYDTTIAAICYPGDRSAVLLLSCASGHRQVIQLDATIYSEIKLLASIFGRDDAVLEVATGEVEFIGLAVDPDMLCFYANRRMGVEHLPLA